ncbi:MAG: hypothetical protein HYZ44_07140 [Bacteroidetes bacterium]|nr:hypothetical protein [Bacteroidota bacterium]
MMNLIRINLILLFTVSLEAYAQVDTLRSIPEKWITQSLRQETAQYLVFFQNKKKPKQAGTFIWSRQLKVKNNTIEVEQKWYSSDSTSYRYVYSLVDRKTFLPIYHKTIMQRSGIEAFDFTEQKIKGSDSVANNTKATFELAASKTLNWELDLETFSLLDLKPGKRFAINFYHPGGRTGPAFYEYKVTGDEKVHTYEDKVVDCWKLRIDYSDKYYAIFYISKKSKEVIKMEEDFGAGVRYKVKLPFAIMVR